MATKIQALVPNDPTGLRQKFTELLELAREKRLEAVVISHKVKGTVGGDSYWNGNDFVALGLCDLAKKNILDTYTLTDETHYEDIDPEPDGKDT